MWTRRGGGSGTVLSDTRGKIAQHLVLISFKSAPYTAMTKCRCIPENVRKHLALYAERDFLIIY